jgi:opacity protein-like surface antigen
MIISFCAAGAGLKTIISVPASFLLGAIASAHAADVSVPRPVTSPAPQSWTGPYLGASFGDRWSNSSWTTTGIGDPLAPPTSAAVTPAFVPANSATFRAGAYLGFNVQIAPWLLVGVEGDIAGGNGRKTIAGIPGTDPGSLIQDSASIKTGWDASVRGRLGLLVAPSLLLYGTGGVAWQQFGVSATCTGAAGTTSWCVDTRGETNASIKTGWTAGGGLEARLGGNWLGRVEYRYSKFGRVDHDFFANAPIDQVVMHAPLRTQTILTGIGYQFALGETAPPPPPIFTKAAPLAAAASVPTWVTTFATDVRYYSWKGNRGYPANVPTATGNGGGSEVYVPFALQLIGRPTDDVKIEILGRGGWVWARQTTAGLAGEVATTTDTVVAGTVTYLGLNGIQPFVSINANLPTGRSSLPGTAAFARMDPDLVGVGSFGEGFNIGPSVGFSLPITPKFILTTSAGYTWRGGYDRENSLTAIGPTVQTAARIDPGDVLTVTQTAAWEMGQLKTVITGSVSDETPTIENGVATFKSGRRYLASANWGFTWADIGVTTLTAGASHANSNKVLFLGVPTLAFERMNTNSDVFRVGLQHLFPIAGLAIGPSGSYLFRNHNGYDADTLQFVPAKERWTAGVLARYAANDKIMLNARADHIWTREDENPAPGGMKLSVLGGSPIPAVAVPVVSSTGWQFTGGLNARF